MIALLGAAAAKQHFNTPDVPNMQFQTEVREHKDKVQKSLEWGQHVLSECDTDKTDGLSFDEVIACVNKYVPDRKDTDAKIQKKFTHADKNGDGELEMQEFKGLKADDVQKAAKLIRKEGLDNTGNKQHRVVKASKEDGGHPEKRKMKKAAKRMVAQIDQA